MTRAKTTKDGMNQRTRNKLKCKLLEGNKEPFSYLTVWYPNY